jgi:hypothetical protein
MGAPRHFIMSGLIGIRQERRTFNGWRANYFAIWRKLDRLALWTSKNKFVLQSLKKIILVIYWKRTMIGVGKCRLATQKWRFVVA